MRRYDINKTKKQLEKHPEQQGTAFPNLEINTKMRLCEKERKIGGNSIKAEK